MIFFVCACVTSLTHKVFMLSWVHPHLPIWELLEVDGPQRLQFFPLLASIISFSQQGLKKKKRKEEKEIHVQETIVELLAGNTYAHGNFISLNKLSQKGLALRLFWIFNCN